MSMALNAKNELDFVDGTLPQPPTEDPTANIFSCCNSMVTYWLFNSVSKENLDTTQDVWSDLHDQFH